MVYTGQVVPIPVGTDALTGSVNQSQHNPDQLIVAQDISYRSGTIRKEGGTTKYNSTAITGTPSILAGWDWWPTTSTQRMVVATSAGALLKDTGAGDFTVTLKSGLTVSNATISFTEGGAEVATNDRKLFIFTGQNVVQVLAADGATTSDISTPPADWATTNQPTGGLIHEDRLWGYGNANDPHRIYYSTVGDHENFTGSGAGTLSIYPGEGEKIVYATSFRGYIVVFKFPVGIYIIDTASALWLSGSEVKIKRVTQELGTLNGHSVVQIDNDLLFLSSTGSPHILSATSEFGDISTGDIGQRVDLSEYIDRNVAVGSLNKTQAVYYEFAKEAHFALPGLGDTANTARLVVDFNRKIQASTINPLEMRTVARFRWSVRDDPISMWMRKDSDSIQRPVYGDDGGFVYLVDNDTRSFAGTGYEGKFQSSHMDLSHLEPKMATIRKIGDFLELVVEPTGNWNLSVDIFWDGTYEDTYYYNMGITGATLGAFVLDTDQLAGDAVVNVKHRITGSGRRISIAGYNNGEAQDFSVGAFFLHFRPGDERLD